MRPEWLWDKKYSEAQVKQILRDPKNSRFAEITAIMLARNNQPKKIFKRYIKAKLFCVEWPSIKRRMRSNKWNDERIVFWQGIYDYLVARFKKSGISIAEKRKSLGEEARFQELGNIVKKARRDAGLTQAGLARKMKVSQQVISRIESGRGNASFSTLSSIARALKKRVKIILE